MIDPADGVTRPLCVEAPLWLRFVLGDRSYSALLQQDLFGDWLLMQCWASPRMRGGRTRRMADFEAGLARLAHIRKVREKQGFALVTVVGNA
jgi:hypothetical protein